MKLIFLYGPPAVGKYTVGAELARQTGFRNIHNHVSVDVARLLFGKKTDDNRQQIADLKDALRLDIIKSAAAADINLITTLAYTAGESDGFVQGVQAAVTAAGGTVCFVRLHAPEQLLLDRVGNESRKLLHKPTDQASLERKFAKGGLDEPISFVESLELDTSELSPEQSAQRIIKAFDL